jgi:RNA polymerase sigma factor (sigma-70 family)
MKINDPGLECLEAAMRGDLAALDEMLLTIQPGIYNLAVRMLGHRDNAADATQEILIRVVTHLASFRSDSRFTTWVYQVARRHLLDAITKAREYPEVSLEAMNERLQAGLEYTASLGDPLGQYQSMTPQDKLEARQVALGCTQNMLMTLEREQRLAYLLDVVFNLPSKEAAEVMDCTPETYRQRLARARSKLDTFTQKTCGLSNPQANCHCSKQVPALKHVRSQGQATPPGVFAMHQVELEQTKRQFDALLRMSDAAALMRAHPQYLVPETLQASIRSVLKMEGFWDGDPALH